MRKVKNLQVIAPMKTSTVMPEEIQDKTVQTVWRKTIHQGKLLYMYVFEKAYVILGSGEDV